MVESLEGQEKKKRQGLKHTRPFSLPPCSLSSTIRSRATTWEPPASSTGWRAYGDLDQMMVKETVTGPTEESRTTDVEGQREDEPTPQAACAE